jgi:quercetin dioxygenase-like cupin family protein
MKIAKLAALAALVVAAPAAAFAQAAPAPAPSAAPAPPPQVQRQELVKQMFPPEKYATFIYMVTVAPGGVVALHTHPGIEMGYTLEGEAVLSVDGQPDLIMKPGVPYSVPPGVPHSAKNTGASTIKIVATFVVEKDKPLATPVKR